VSSYCPSFRASLNPQPQGNRRQRFRSKAAENLINKEPTDFAFGNREAGRVSVVRFPVPQNVMDAKGVSA
jgi:hypothetical protein